MISRVLKGLHCCACHSKIVRYTVGTIVAVQAVRLVRSSVVAYRRKAAAQKRLAAQEPNTVNLFMFPKDGPNVVSLAGPAAAVETFFRLFKVKYTITETMDSDASPTERLPYAEFNGRQVAESFYIVDEVKKSVAGVTVPTLTAEQEAIGHSARRIVTETLRFGFYRYFMVDRPDLQIARMGKSIKMPAFVLRMAIMHMFRPNIIKMLNMHGHGDLTDEQYHGELVQDVKALEALLSKHRFLVTDDTPTEYDCIVFAWLYQFRSAPAAASFPALEFVRESKVINAYLDEIVKLAGYDEQQRVPLRLSKCRPRRDVVRVFLKPSGGCGS